MGPAAIDLKLIKLFQIGDLNAFEKIMRIESPRLIGFIHRYLRSQDIADDIYQEIWTIVWVKREQLMQVESFRAWLYQISRNVIYENLRKKSWTLNIEFYGDESELTSIIDPDLDPREQADLNKWGCILEEELKKLGPEIQEMLLLRFSGGLNMRVVAGVMNIKPSTLRTKTCRALETLRNNLIRRGLVWKP